MRFFGLNIPLPWGRQKAAVAPIGVANWLGGWLHETYAGAWQAHVTVETRENILAFGAVYACVSLISKDVGKLCLDLMRYSDKDKVWTEADTNTAHNPLLRKPNRYQTRNLFFEQWIISKLVNGNTYVLKERDERKVVRALYILDPRRCLPAVAPDGSVFYQLGGDNLAGIEEGLPMVPASEIIHDRHTCLFHPLVGLGPLYASALSATQGTRIQKNSAKFFENMSRPSGQLTAPGTINDITAARLKAQFEKDFSGPNIGRLLVAGDGLKFEGFTIPADQAQMIEQLRWTVEDVARAFLVPLYKIGAAQLPAINNVAALNLEYYQQVIQPLLEGAESLLNDGLELDKGLGVEFDIDGLVRMDGKTRAETNEIEIKSAALTPNEARRKENRPPMPGGDALYMQQQNYSLEALAKRDASDDPFGKKATTPAAAGGAAANDDQANADDMAAGIASARRKFGLQQEVAT